MLIVLSTSGKSKNLIEACKAARRCGMTSLALLGKDGGDLIGLADHSIVVPAMDTARIQEVQILVLHLACELIELNLFTQPVHKAREKLNRQSKRHRPVEEKLPAKSPIPPMGMQAVDVVLPGDGQGADKKYNGSANGNGGLPKYPNSKSNGELSKNEKLGWKSHSGNGRGTRPG